MIQVIYAHPYPSRSRASRDLVEAVRTLPDVRIRALYDLYPDFDIHVPAEHEALREADLLVLLCPIYWFSVPGLLKHWFDKVLVRGWAHGVGGVALHGKHCLLACVAGGDEFSLMPECTFEQAQATVVAPVEETLRYCGMHWETPLVVAGAHLVGDTELAAQAHEFRERLVQWSAAHGGGGPDKNSTAEKEGEVQ